MAAPGSHSDTAYVERHTLTAGHSDTINYLSFSPDGSHLASGGDDYALIIWNALQGRLLYRLLFKSPVGCVIWHPVHPETVIAGCDNGYLFQLHDFNLDTSEQHEINLGARSNVICLDYDTSRRLLAVGLGNEVHITREVQKNKYSGDKILPPPQGAVEPSGDANSRLRPISVHFVNDGQQLIVSYLSHGVTCWSTDSTAVVWHISPPAQTPEIGGSALSPDRRSLIVYNMASGVTRYSIASAKGASKIRQFYKLDKQARSKVKLQTSFLHDGRAAICGTTTGQVCIWNVKTGEHFQLLAHASDVVQAIATAQRGDVSYVATGSADKGQQTYIKIWRAKIKQTAGNPALEDAVAKFVQVITLDQVEVNDGISLGVVIATTVIVCFVFVWICTLMPWGWAIGFAAEMSVIAGGVLKDYLLWIGGMGKAAGLTLYGIVCEVAQYVGRYIRAKALSFLFPNGAPEPFGM